MFNYFKSLIAEAKALIPLSPLEAALQSLKADEPGWPLVRSSLSGPIWFRRAFGPGRYALYTRRSRWAEPIGYAAVYPAVCSVPGCSNSS